MIRRCLVSAAALIFAISLAPTIARAQTMGEYAGVAAGTGTITGASSFTLNPPSESQGSSSWSTSAYGPSSGGFGGSAISQFPSYEARAAELSGRSGDGDSRWPGTGFTERASSNESRFTESESRFPQTRFNDNGLSTDFSGRMSQASASGVTGDARWPGSAFHDHQGLDERFNSLNGY